MRVDDTRAMNALVVAVFLAAILSDTSASGAGDGIDLGVGGGAAGASSRPVDPTATADVPHAGLHTMNSVANCDGFGFAESMAECDMAAAALGLEDTVSTLVTRSIGSMPHGCFYTPSDILGTDPDSQLWFNRGGIRCVTLLDHPSSPQAPHSNSLARLLSRSRSLLLS